MGFKILAINPGSTSTKIALYEDEKELFTETLTHDIVELEKYEHVQDQFLMRKKVVEAALETRGLDVLELAAVVGRGGMLPPVKSGAYEVNEVMLDVLKNRPMKSLRALASKPIFTILYASMNCRISREYPACR
jgi:butyrate kinase